MRVYPHDAVRNVKSWRCTDNVIVFAINVILLMCNYFYAYNNEKTCICARKAKVHSFIYTIIVCMVIKTIKFMAKNRKFAINDAIVIILHLLRK